MSKLLRTCLLAGSLVLASISNAQQTGMSLRVLAFLSGRWVSEKQHELQEETWSSVNGDSMTGSFRVVQGGKPVFYEFWVVEIDDNRPVLKMKHFNANLAGWEEKNESIKMPLVSSSAGDAVFEAANGSVSLHYHRSGGMLSCAVHHVRDDKASDEIFTLTRAIEH